MNTFELTLTPSSYGLPVDMSQTAFSRGVEGAAQRWNEAVSGCGIAIRVAPLSTEWRAVDDGVNLVVIRGRTWCHNERCGTDSTFPAGAAGMTTTFPDSDATGSVREADIELNGVSYQLAQDAIALSKPSEDQRPKASIRAILVHEIGHALGLRDVCGTQRTFDGKPNTANCTTTEMESAMFATVRAEKPSKEDVLELCRLHGYRRSWYSHLGVAGWSGVFAIALLLVSLWRLRWSRAIGGTGGPGRSS